MPQKNWSDTTILRSKHTKTSQDKVRKISKSLPKLGYFQNEMQQGALKSKPYNEFMSCDGNKIK